MQIIVLKEIEPSESRVALIPESVQKLVAMKVRVAVESGAGLESGANDTEYITAGATISPDRAVLLESADVLVTVNRPAARDIARMKRGSVVIGFLRPLDEPEKLSVMMKRGITAFAMELIPRTTRAQSMDALSSMATIMGYKAVLLAASHVPRMFPMLTTAAGTVPPAKVLVLGAGVAGFDVRSAAGEAVRSLGAKFLDVDLGGLQTEDAGGYAREVTEEVMQRSRDLIARQAKQIDCVITSATVPGRRAPVLITEEAVTGMKRGSVIIDLAGPTGGNCI